MRRWLPRCAIPRQLCNLTFSNNIRRMRRIMHDASFEQLLEQARNEQNLQSIRTYLHLYSEYHTYLTREQKGKLLAFLYELLMHHDGDVRPPGSPDYGSDSQQQRPQIPQGTAGRRRGSGQCAESAVLPQRIAAGLGSVCRGLPAPGSENYAQACAADFQLADDYRRERVSVFEPRQVAGASAGCCSSRPERRFPKTGLS